MRIASYMAQLSMASYIGVNSIHHPTSGEGDSVTPGPWWFIGDSITGDKDFNCYIAIFFKTSLRASVYIGYDNSKMAKRETSNPPLASLNL